MQMARGLGAGCAGLGLLLLAGCNLAPHYHVPLANVPVAYKEARNWQAARPADRLPRGSWWTLFGDPALDRLESQIDSANPTLQAALASYQRARNLAAEAEAGLTPSIAVGGQVNSDRQSNRRPHRGLGQPNSYLDNVVDVQAHYEIDVWEQIANEIRTGRDLAQAAAADLEDTRLSLHAELAGDYIGMRGLDAEADVLRQAVRVFGQGVAITRARFQGAISPLLDVTRAEAQLDNAEAQLTDVLARRALLEHAIAVLIGRPPSALDLPATPWRIALPEVSPGLPSTLLERRPDIASAERQVAAANANIGVARAAFYPTLSLNLLYGLEDTGFNLFSLPNDFWAVGPGLALPVFEGGLRHAEEAAAVEADRIAVAEYRETVLAAFQEVEDQLSDIRYLGEEQQQQSAAAQQADQSLQMATALYKDGASNFLDVLVAQNSDLEAQQAVVAIRTRRVQASLGLIRALGGGWSRQDLPAARHISATD